MCNLSAFVDWSSACSPDRLPHYVKVFSKAVNEQTYRYTDVPRPDGLFHDSSEPGEQQAAGEESAGNKVDASLGSPVGGEPIKAVLTDLEKQHIRENTVLNFTMKPDYSMVSRIDS